MFCAIVEWKNGSGWLVYGSIGLTINFFIAVFEHTTPNFTISEAVRGFCPNILWYQFTYLIWLRCHAHLAVFWVWKIFGLAMGSLAQLHLAKIWPMAQPNPPDMPANHTKKARLDIMSIIQKCKTTKYKVIWSYQVLYHETYFFAWTSTLSKVTFFKSLSCKRI